MYLCASGIVETRFPLDYSLLIEERIVNIGIPTDSSGFWCFNDFLSFEICSGIWLFANPPNMHNGGVNRWKVCGFSCGVSDK